MSEIMELKELVNQVSAGGLVWIIAYKVLDILEVVIFTVLIGYGIKKAYNSQKTRIDKFLDI